MNVKILPTFERAVQENIVEILNEFLGRATAGEFDQIMLVAFREGGDTTYRISKGVDILHKLGALEMLKQKLLND